MLPAEMEDLLPRVPRSWIVGAAGLVLVVASSWAWSCRGQRIQTAHVLKADQIDRSALQNGAQGAAHEQEAQDRQPQLDQDAAEVERRRKEVARLRPALPAGAAPLPDGPASLPEPVAPGALGSPLDVAKDALIASLERLSQDQAAQIRTLTLEARSYQAAFTQAQAAEVELRAALAARSTHVWAMGGSYGTDGQAGAWAERDLGRVRIGLDIIRHPLAAGNSTLEAVARIGWSF